MKYNKIAIIDFDVHHGNGTQNIFYEEKIKLIETQLFFIEDNIQALENYKKQINQVLLEIQTDLIQISDNNTKANEVIDKAE